MMNRRMSLLLLLLLLICLGVSMIVKVEGQQSYVDNHQLDCYNHFNSTDGNVCNGVSASCVSHLTFRSDPGYNTPIAVGYLMGSDPSVIAQANNVSDVDAFPTTRQLILIPVNCSCSGGVGGRAYYQHNASYVLKRPSETYFSLANNTYQGLTTCQALMAQNPYDSHNLTVGMNLRVPLRCACPTANQRAAGVKYLLSYLVASGDNISSIAQRFRVPDEQTLWDANMLSSTDIIYPFTPILVPLAVDPSTLQLAFEQAPPPPPPPSAAAAAPPPPAAGESNSNSSKKKWILVGVGTGAAALLLLLLALCVAAARLRKAKTVSVPPPKKEKKSAGGGGDSTPLPTPESWSSISSQGARYATESISEYKLEEVQRATESFSERNKIGGGGSSVYRGLFKGDAAAVKIMKGDVASEINILKRINHSNIVRLSGFCIHGGNTYLVYEYADNGSVADWLRPQQPNNNNRRLTLSWKHRVRIAHDVADALNYLHNYTNPPCIHKNLKTSNILLDGSFRAKVSNFGQARTVALKEEEQGPLQLTRHVIGTQGYMAPEYIENGVITTKLDVFAFGVVLLELLSGREAISNQKNGVGGGGEELLSASISEVLLGDNAKEKLHVFVDPHLEDKYPLDLAFSMAQLAKSCVDRDLNSRPAITEAFMILSKILSSSLDWDPSDELEHSMSPSQGR